MYKAVLGAICCLSFALSLHAQSPQEKGLQSISRTSAKAIVGFLADDELQGREAGMHGSRLAARYLASCLKEAGIAPLEKDNYYQPFEAYNKERQQRGRWQVHPDSIAILKQGVHRILQMSNVLGTIPGERPDEYVIVGAHFDHLGVDETLANDRIYNGADDNASGISAVLQIARAFLATGQKPLRTVIFAFWDGEEKGLLGSKYFVQSCPFISQVKGYLNFDMIGRNNKPEQPQHVVYFYTAAHPLDHTLRDEELEYAKPITVGDSVWIGGGVTVLPGVTIGSRAVIGGGSVVVHDIPEGVVAVGNPCRPIRTL